MFNLHPKKYLLTIIGLLAIFILLTTGCSYQSIKPWHRDVLSQDRAQIVSDTLEFDADEHIYSSKEAPKGGQGIGGGGCGCN